MVAWLRRAWRQLRERSSDGPSPTIGIAIVVAATAAVLIVGWAFAAITALVY